MSITIKEVAKKANVSVATVSRVINENYPVKKETKERVLKVIEEVNFVPNMQARELTQKKSNIIGVVVPSLTNMFFPNVVYGIETELKKNSLSIILMTTSNDKNEETKCINDLLSRNVSGIIVIDPNTSNIKNKFYHDISKKLPLVFINGYTSVPNISSISNDEAIGCEVALNYLIENNHKNILFLRGRDSYSYDIKENVYKNKMMEIGSFNPNYIIDIGQGNTIETVDNTTDLMMTLLPKLKATAVFACNDLMAIGVMNSCKKLNISIPKDLSIIGYDNIQLSSLVEPKLTTIDQHMELLGSKAAILVLDKIAANNEYGVKTVIDNTLVERESVAKILD
ncbi:MAG: LacI family DNA-binding transcriptional regulator [Clostridium sp.]